MRTLLPDSRVLWLHNWDSRCRHLTPLFVEVQPETDMDLPSPLHWKPFIGREEYHKAWASRKAQLHVVQKCILVHAHDFDYDLLELRMVVLNNCCCCLRDVLLGSPVKAQLSTLECLLQTRLHEPVENVAISLHFGHFSKFVLLIVCDWNNLQVTMICKVQ
jgi:hypothetical protein